MVGELYLSLVSKHPWRVWGIQSAVTMGFSDFLCQFFFERKCGLAEVDPTRMARFAAMGLFYTGPGVRTWYMLLDRIVPHQGKMAVASKVALDQGLFAPLFTGAFMVITALLQQQPWDRVETKLRTISGATVRNICEISVEEHEAFMHLHGAVRLFSWPSGKRHLLDYSHKWIRANATNRLKPTFEVIYYP